jgi:hypothetical protein
MPVVTVEDLDIVLQRMSNDALAFKGLPFNSISVEYKAEKEIQPLYDQADGTWKRLVQTGPRIITYVIRDYRNVGKIKGD